MFVVSRDKCDQVEHYYLSLNAGSFLAMLIELVRHRTTTHPLLHYILASSVHEKKTIVYN